MKKRPIRASTHAWAVLYTMAHFHVVMNEGYKVIREKRLTAESLNSERAILYFVLRGVVGSLAEVEEAINLLSEMEPALRNVGEPFKEDFMVWRRFRDDAAHTVDRTHRVSRLGQNDARLREDAYGYDAETVAYDYEADMVTTGTLDRLPLRASIDKAYEAMQYADRCIQEAASHRRLLRTPRLRA